MASVFNGDFELGTKTLFQGNNQFDFTRFPKQEYGIPGWSFHNGLDNGAGFSSSYIGQVMLVHMPVVGSNRAAFTDGHVVRINFAQPKLVHNPMWISNNFSFLRFDSTVATDDASTKLKVFIEEGGVKQQIGSFDITERTYRLSQHVIKIPTSLQQKVGKLSFELDNPSVVRGEVWLDNIQFDNVDTTGPQVLPIPVRTLTNQDVTGAFYTMRVNFNESIDAASFAASSLTVTDAAGNRLNATVNRIGDTAYDVLFPPGAGAGRFGQYSIAIDTSVKDVAGNALASAFGQTFNVTDGITFRFDYTGPKPEDPGFDPRLPSFHNPVLAGDVRDDLQYAGGVWSAALKAKFSGETLTSQVEYQAQTGATLASAAATSDVSRSTPVSARYPITLANHLSGSDQNGADPEIGITVNNLEHFYYGLDIETNTNLPPNSNSLLEAIVHEIGHGLGFDSAIASDGSYGAGATIWDTFLVSPSGTLLTSLSDADRLTSVLNVNPQWSGPKGVAANGGTRPIIEMAARAPNFSLARNPSHLDENTFPNLIMSPTLTQPFTLTLVQVERGILEDMGWDLNIPSNVAPAPPPPPPASPSPVGNSGGVSSPAVLAGGVRPSPAPTSGPVSSPVVIARGVHASTPAGVSAGTVIAKEKAPQPTILQGPAAPQGSLVNGDFAIADATDPGFGWTARGNAAVNAAGQAVIGEGGSFFGGFSQSFVVPAGVTKLRFTITDPHLVDNGAGAPPDAFEVALLDAQTGTPVAGVVGGLSGTDALLNIQFGGQTFFAPGVSIGGLTVSGSSLVLNGPLAVEVDLSGVTAGTPVTLYFDLLGFGTDGSSVSVDDVTLVGAGAPPSLSVALDPASDSAAKGDSLTNITPVTITGLSDPNQTVLLDIDGDGFDDGTATANVSGAFTFTGVVLKEGTNTLRFRATNSSGSTDRSLVVTLDTIPPPVQLALDPASDTGVPGDLKTTAAVVTLNGVTEPGLVVTLDQTGATVTAGTDGTFSFAGVPLNAGANLFTARTTDAAGNAGQTSITVTRTTGPSVTAALAQDTGTSATDRITSIATIAGGVASDLAITLLEASLDGGAFFDITSSLGAVNQQFTLLKSLLEQVKGSSLVDGPHTLVLRATDQAGTHSDDFILTFTLDTRPPRFTPPVVINDGNVQRSAVFRIQFGFDENVGPAFGTDDLRLIRNGSEVVPLAGAIVSVDPTTHAALVNLKNVAMPDGDYELRILPDGLTDIAGNALDVDNDGLGDGGSGKFVSIPFFKLAGDVDADQRVTALDLLAVRKSLDLAKGQAGYDANSDINDTNAVDAADLSIVNVNMGHTLHVLAPPHMVVEESSGTANDDQAVFSGPASQPFAPVVVTIRNTGERALTIASLQIVGPDAATFSFQVVGDPAGNTGFILAAGQSKQIRIDGMPATAGRFLAYLRWWHNDPSSPSPHAVTLNGDSTGAAAPVGVSAGVSMASERPVGVSAAVSLAPERTTPSQPASNGITSTTKPATKTAAARPAPVKKAIAPFAGRAMRLQPLPASTSRRPFSAAVNGARSALFNRTPIAPPASPAQPMDVDMRPNDDSRELLR
ncbi:MAG TPA: Ig-like domain-containing protein [Tepidisphaeraceae bacterium]